jgi:hypothetical protein
MSNHELPRRGSAAATGLITLQGMGGMATVSAWLRAKGWRASRALFFSDVVDRLMRAQLVILEGERFIITNAGYKYLGVKIEGEAEAPATPVGPRYAAPMRALNIGRHRPARIIRPGSMDFREIPSRIGDDLVAYKGPRGFSGATGSDVA